MIAVVTFAIGVAGLLVAANFVVSGSSELGLRFGLSPTVVGLTIVAAGTSAPELAVVGQAVANGDTELAVGSIIGSNIANVLLVLGVVASIGAVRVESRVVRIDVPVMIVASLLFVAVSLDNSITQVEAGLLFLGIVAFTVWTIRSTRSPRLPAAAPADGDSAGAESGPAATRVGVLVGKLVLGVAGLALAARLVVSGASSIASSLGVSELIIGLTVVAIGTSAPEIITTVVAAARGQAELAVGNAVGSNIYNVLFVLGAVGVFTPAGIAVSSEALALDLPVMIAAAVACVPVLVGDRVLNRWEGVMFLGYYVAYLTFLALDASDHDATDSFILFFGWIVIPLTVITLVTVMVRQLRARAQPVGDRA
ncbi:MAG: calcium/sodium antiporter [Actinomycetota bacterium]